MTVRAQRVGLDILFADAGIGAFAPLGEITPEHYDQIFDVNVKGTIFTVQKALPLMTAGASIILSGSTTGAMGRGRRFDADVRKHRRNRFPPGFKSHAGKA